MSPSFEAEFILWDIVKEIGSISELKKWDLEDIDKFYAMILLKRDYEKAIRMDSRIDEGD